MLKGIRKVQLEYEMPRLLKFGSSQCRKCCNICSDASKMGAHYISYSGKMLKEVN